jgi:hypothetical protein
VAVAEGAVDKAVDDMHAKLDTFVQEQMNDLSQAKDEYMALMGGEKPNCACIARTRRLMCGHHQTF